VAKHIQEDLRLVCVEWEDSCGAIARWQYLDESEPEYILAALKPGSGLRFLRF
jgi:hypothetical protein